MTVACVICCSKTKLTSFKCVASILSADMDPAGCENSSNSNELLPSCDVVGIRCIILAFCELCEFTVGFAFSNAYAALSFLFAKLVIFLAL